MRARKVVTLAQERLRRLERRLDHTERRIRELNVQLDQATELLTRLVRVVAAQSRQSRKTLGRLDERLRRLARDITTSRTTDVRRLATLQRRLSTLEGRRRGDGAQ
jgi:hypothetical protein